MRFKAEHHFSGPVDAVIGELVDPEFHRELELPDLAPAEVLNVEAGSGATHLELRYLYTGSIDPMARRLLGGRDLSWRQELWVDRAERTGWLSFAADADPRKLHGRADFVLEPVDDGAATVRRLDGELVVKVPLIGGMAERSIVPGLLRRLDIEAEALESRLSPDR